MVGVGEAGVSLPEEGPVPPALDALKGPAAHRGLLHLLPALTTERQTPVPNLISFSLVRVQLRRVALDEFLRQESANVNKITLKRT